MARAGPFRRSLDMTLASLNFRSTALAETGGAMLNLVLLAGTLSAIWFVFLMNIVSSGEAKVAEESKSTSLNSVVVKWAGICCLLTH